MAVETAEIHKELDLIQACITRMASNSFQIKGWAYTSIGIVVGLLANAKLQPYVISLVGIPLIISFWWIDAFFLSTERKYRQKYAWVLEERPKGNRDFLYDLIPYKNKMVAKPEDVLKASIPNSMFSKTLLPFYGIPILVGIVPLIMKIATCSC